MFRHLNDNELLNLLDSKTQYSPIIAELCKRLENNILTNKEVEELENEIEELKTKLKEAEEDVTLLDKTIVSECPVCKSKLKVDLKYIDSKQEIELDITI